MMYPRIPQDLTEQPDDARPWFLWAADAASGVVLIGFIVAVFFVSALLFDTPDAHRHQPRHSITIQQENDQ